MATVLVTGTSKGIGLATALTLARAGHTVYATMRSAARAAELSAEAAREALPIRFSVMDVDADSSVATAVAAIHAAAGNIDALVNNAGIERNGSIEETPLSAFREVMETNYFGAIRCIQAVLPHMRERRSGLIVNISSVAGRVATSPLGPYSATKHALEALSEALAQEVKAFNIRVAIVEPGIIDTPMAHELHLPAAPSLYPQQRRMAAYFAAALQDSARDPRIVADKIRQIVESGAWTLRHPVGPGAAEHIETRRATSDEDYTALQAADDDTWYTFMEQRSGMSIRPKS